MRRVYLSVALIMAVPLAGVLVWWASPGRAQPVAKAPETPRRLLPLSRLVLFNTGIAYFQREGTVESDSRVDLSFPLTDVNDLLKSLVVEDGDKLAAVSYDGAEPAERTLKAFAVDLTSNPTFGQILNQSRGEKIEIVQGGAAVGLPATMTGVIVGMEAGIENGVNEVHHLNLLSTEGMRRIPLSRIQRIRFLNPTMEDEFRRALSVLSASHNNQRRSLSIQLKGEGKRNVKVGYVVESPIWKASYRLVLDGKDKKPKLQGWAVIENTSDEDWKDLRLVLVSGRPISFEMDLSQPLFVPRPTVDPEIYASLRPPRHERAVAVGGGLGALGGGALGALGGGALGALGGGGIIGGGAGASGAQIGGFGFGGGSPGGASGSGMPPTFVNRYQTNPGTVAPSTRLSWEELVARRKALLEERQSAREKARQVGSAIGAMDETLESIAVDADRIGEGFQYIVNEKATLARQKSALLPILDEKIEVSRWSIYNKSVHPRFPLYGVKVKNTTGQHLLQGPVAVFADDTFAGDTRMPDMQPNEERLISYAMDLGVEIRDSAQATTHTVVKVVIEKGVIKTKTTWRNGTNYTFRNRSKSDRSLLVEHPITAGWTLVDTVHPVEKSRDLYRFAWTIPAGKTVRHGVVEETLRDTSFEIDRADAAYLRRMLAHPQVNKTIKEVIETVIARRDKLEAAGKETSRLHSELVDLQSDQARLRINLEKLPAGSAAHKRALDKFDQLETQIEKLQAAHRQQFSAEKDLLSAYQTYVSRISVK